MTGKIKRRSLRCGGRPKADFGSIFNTFIAPALGVAGSVADSAISKTQVSKSNTKPAVKETNTEVTNNNTSVENLPTIQVPTKKPISGLVTSNTVIPPDPTKTPAMRLGGRKKCWIGAAIMGATSIAGSLFGSAAKKREMRRQKSIQDWQNTTQEAANMTTALNNSQDYQEDYLRQFRTAARLGKTLGAKGIYITDGGDATKIGNNTYLLRGGSHEDINETGQTGIGINVGGNEVEAEGGEVAQKKNGALRIFSAQPILGGVSPAQAVMNGASKDKVFNAQQQFKRRNHLSDDGETYKNAGLNKYPIDKLTYAYGLPSQESHNGRIASGNIVNKNKSYNTKEYNNAIANMNVFKNFGVIPANVVVRNWSNKNDAATDKKNAYNLSTNLSPLYQSFDLFRRGLYNTGDKNHTNDVKTAGDLIINSPEFKTYWETSGKRQYTRGYNDTNKASSYDRMINSNKEYSRYINHYPNKRLFKLGGRCKLRNGGLTSKDRGSSKHPYPSVSSKDFAGGGRSYPIPTKADAVDALRLAGLHGRSDVRSKVFNKYPSLRKKSLLGSSNRPVKGMRPKAAIGIYTPFNKRYTSIYDAPDYDSDYNGGNVLGNGEVTITAKRIKPTFMKPNNDAMNLIKVPKEEVPYIPQKHNRSRTIFSGGDYLGLGIDTLAALSTGLVNYNTAGKYTLPDRAPIIQASKLPTTYNVNPEIEEVKRYRDRLTGQTFNNTSSSVAALNRSGTINLDALSNLSKLWATKENEENKMLTEDAKNQQTVAAQNVQNELARQSEIARIKNEATQAKGDALNIGLSGLSQAWTNFWTAGRTAYEDDQSRRAMIASSKEATPTRLSEMDFDLSPDILASLYRTAKDDRTRRFYLSRLSPKQRQKYGIN